MDIIIVAGISGMDKARFLRSLVKKAGIEDDSEIIRFEDALVNPARRAVNVTPPTTITSFLNDPSAARRLDTIEKTFTWIADAVRAKKKTRRIFLDIHLTYYHRSEFFPPLNPSHFAGWIDSIDQHANVKILTLIDDVFNTWSTLSGREGRYPGTRLTLREILAWRSLEVLQSESLAYSLNAPNAGSKQAKAYPVSVRHPLSTFKNIVLRDVPVVAYLSFPISRTRNDEGMVGEVNAFRSKMHRIGTRLGVAILDPVTIDEMILVHARQGRRAPPLAGRWPLVHATLPPSGRQDIDIPPAEIEDAKASLTHQVRSRDLRLVEASNLLVAYRPCLPELSTGVMAEIGHATSIGEDVCIYSPPGDCPASSANPFSDQPHLEGDLDDFYKTVCAKLAEIKARSTEFAS